MAFKFGVIVRDGPSPVYDVPKYSNANLEELRNEGAVYVLTVTDSHTGQEMYVPVFGDEEAEKDLADGRVPIDATITKPFLGRAGISGYSATQWTTE